LGLAFIKSSEEHRQDNAIALAKRWSIFKQLKKVEIRRKSLTRPNCLQALGHNASAEAMARVTAHGVYDWTILFLFITVTDCAWRQYDNNVLIKVTDDLKYIFTVRQIRNSVTYS
jgi:hypothetical protein